jgi:hypothetical protein
VTPYKAAADSANAAGRAIARDMERRFEDAHNADIPMPSFASVFNAAVVNHLKGRKPFVVDPGPIQELAARLRVEQTCFATLDPKDVNQDTTYVGHLFRQLGQGDRRLKCPMLTAQGDGFYLLHEACSCACGRYMRSPAQKLSTMALPSRVLCRTCGQYAPTANRPGDLCPNDHPYELSERSHDVMLPAYDLSDVAEDWERSIATAVNHPEFRYIGLNIPAAVMLVIQFGAAGAFIIDGAGDGGVDVVAVGPTQLTMAQVKANLTLSATADATQRLRGSRLVLGSDDEVLDQLERLVCPDREKLTGDLFDVALDALVSDAKRRPVLVSHRGWTENDDVIEAMPVDRWGWHEIAAVVSGADHQIPNGFDDWVDLALSYNVVATRGALTKVVGRMAKPSLV